MKLVLCPYTIEPACVIVLESRPRLLLTSAEANLGVGMVEHNGGQTSYAYLAAAIFAGDRSAERALVAQLTAPLRLMLRVQRVPIDEREDLLQDSLIVLLKRLRASPLQNAENVEAFLQATVRNLRIGQWRRSDRRDQLLNAHADDAIPSMEITPEVRLDANILNKLVRNAVGSLRQPRDQQLIREHYLEEVGKPELCARLHVSEAHFDRILFNARQRLKTLLNQALGVSE